MNNIQELIAKYEKDIKRLDQRIISSREHPTRTEHMQSTLETLEGVLGDLKRVVATPPTTKPIKEYALELGFVQTKSCLVYDMPRNRQLSFCDVGTPNEMLYICTVSRVDPRRVEDVTTLHNWDYDNYLTCERLLEIVKALDPRGVYCYTTVK